MKALLLLSLFSLSLYLQGQTLSKEESLFIKKHADLLSRDRNFTKIDWNPVLKDVKEADIVLLGEANHGSKEIFQLRNSLIKSLHSKLDFEVILFEAGIGEMIVPNLRKADMDAKALTKGFFSIWQTRAFEDLMDYVKKEEIEIAGFDVQRSGRSFRYLLQEAAGQALIPKLYYEDIEDRFGAVAKDLTQRKPYDQVQENTEKLIADYQKLYKDLARKSPNKGTQKFELIQRVLENRMAYLSYFLHFVKTKDWNKRWADRDSLMAENIKWLSEHIYPGKKLIVIGHNFHIAKYNEKEEVMGEKLVEIFGDKIQSVGIFPRSGSYAGNYREQKEIESSDSKSLDLKDVMAEIDAYASYLKIPKNPKKGSDWLFKKIKVEDTFINLSGDKTMNLSLHFDSLIFVEEVSLPDFLGAIGLY